MLATEDVHDRLFDYLQLSISTLFAFGIVALALTWSPMTFHTQLAAAAAAAAAAAYVQLPTGLHFNAVCILGCGTRVDVEALLHFILNFLLLLLLLLLLYNCPQVSISTLFAFWIVALALMWKRYYTPGSNGKNAMMAGQLLLLVGAALSEY
jgi:hypothetical protein